MALLCAIHLRRNVTDKMVALGIEFEESERTEICADIFGAQVGSQFQEGIIDADDEKEFCRCSSAARSMGDEIWSERQGVPLVVSEI